MSSPGPASRNVQTLEGPSDVFRQEALEDGVGAAVGVAEHNKDLGDCWVWWLVEHVGHQPAVAQADGARWQQEDQQ